MWTQWQGCTVPSADWRGEVFAQGSIGRLNLHVTLHRRQRGNKPPQLQTAIPPPHYARIAAFLKRKTPPPHIYLRATLKTSQYYSNGDMRTTHVYTMSATELWECTGLEWLVWCPVGPQGALMWYMKKKQTRGERECERRRGEKREGERQRGRERKRNAMRQGYRDERKASLSLHFFNIPSSWNFIWIVNVQ